jgi:tartrate dehydratase alpha subunit/fumarate hydratase class I-like protein
LKTTCAQNAALDMYKEVNTGTNLPAQIDLYSVDGDDTNSCAWQKAAVQPTKPISTRKPKR